MNIRQALIQQFDEAGIRLTIQKKSVKNINFRIKPHQLQVSAPRHASDQQIQQAIIARLDWALHHHAALIKKQQAKLAQADAPVLLWGEPQPFIMGDADKLHYYRQALDTLMPSLFAKWQPIVGKYANETRIKKMRTRWGSCNVRAKRIWLSVYLPEYPVECTEYVIVHELCHLHQANHSPKFWRQVAAAMPDYQQWHDMLAGRGGQLD